MRLISRTILLAVVILTAFWFTTENARHIVTIDLAFFRVQASVPLVVFGSVLFGMVLSFLAGWRAERVARRRRAPRLTAGADLHVDAHDSVRGGPGRVAGGRPSDEADLSGVDRDPSRPVEWS